MIEFAHHSDDPPRRLAAGVLMPATLVPAPLAAKSMLRGELTVRDHGPGISPEERDRVFDRFYHSATARAQPGSGLGLAIVRDVAEAHGGTVTAEDAPGGGALLRLRLNGASPNGSHTSS